MAPVIGDSHDCPAPGCAEQVPRTQLACRTHWFKIPKLLRDEVWRTYRYNGMGSAEHVEAITAAIDYLEANAR